MCAHRYALLILYQTQKSPQLQKIGSDERTDPIIGIRRIEAALQGLLETNTALQAAYYPQPIVSHLKTNTALQAAYYPQTIVSHLKNNTALQSAYYPQPIVSHLKTNTALQAAYYPQPAVSHLRANTALQAAYYPQPAVSHLRANTALQVAYYPQPIVSHLKANTALQAAYYPQPAISHLETKTAFPPVTVCRTQPVLNRFLFIQKFQIFSWKPPKTTKSLFKIAGLWTYFRTQDVRRESDSNITAANCQYALVSHNSPSSCFIHYFHIRCQCGNVTNMRHQV